MSLGCSASKWSCYVQWVVVWLCLGGLVTAEVKVQIEAQPGWDIFTPSKDYHYRYGPSLMLNDDGSIDAWFASPGDKGSDDRFQWDWIRYKHSSDGGKTWGAESVVLKATEKARDRMSVCDPAVIKIGEWYYLGVTAVEDEKGNDNEIFVSRSKKPEGPFEKWNGKGWGGNHPQPMIEFRSPADAWGAGEPSFVLKDGKIFIYYTILSHDAKGTATQQTWIGTADGTNPDWPQTFKREGLGWNREKDEDSVDVKYCDQLNLFVAVSTASRMGPEAHILYRQSADGIHWDAPTKLTKNIKAWCHNAGISGTPDGHLDLKRQNYIGYAYSKEAKVNWGVWHTMLHPITITSTTLTQNK
jgi:predicted GH43/DUF377 family glycosyl hydrolase